MVLGLMRTIGARLKKLLISGNKAWSPPAKKSKTGLISTLENSNLKIKLLEVEQEVQAMENASNQIDIIQKRFNSNSRKRGNNGDDAVTHPDLAEGVDSNHIKRHRLNFMSSDEEDENEEDSDDEDDTLLDFNVFFNEFVSNKKESDWKANDGRRIVDILNSKTAELFKLISEKKKADLFLSGDNPKQKTRLDKHY